ncbi:type I restriction endonuclease [Gloeothece verrucosa]|uniref:type I site-specific deoxyribonuclease n=1 Tax=Gloeothece verrucosa (strain PCC 7822) TaxID=497965 RepID=E0UCS3_GLOV7|nr:type I restriction endonuclease [Gloeothece verrucosa]ADN15267.1 protein of unknown function DUF450 [Gloeothece verrucosa PCC 7822]
MANNQIDILTWFEVLGYSVLWESDLAPIQVKEEGVLGERLLLCLERINPQIPTSAILEAFHQIVSLANFQDEKKRQRFRTFLRNGVTVCYPVKDQIVYDKVKLIDCYNLLNNDWLVVELGCINPEKNQQELIAIISREIVIFINGLPLANILIKNPDFKDCSFWGYFQLFSLIYQGKTGQLIAWTELKKPAMICQDLGELESLIQNSFDKRYFLDLVAHLVKFETLDDQICKNTITDFHQYKKIFSTKGYEYTRLFEF